MTSDPATDSTALGDDRAQALALTPVSRETLALLDRYVAMLLDVQRHTNLIAPSTIPIIWTRHIADSLQLLTLVPDAATWIDLGSGAGLPGIAIACAIKEREGASVHLVESNKKKAAFLQTVVQELQLPATVHPVRIEDYVKKLPDRPNVVTARALAPLDVLLGYAHPILERGATGLFLKGQDVEGELTNAAKYWKMKPDLVPSRTNPLSRIVIIREIERRRVKR